MAYKSYLLQGGVVHKVYGNINFNECLMMLQNGWQKTEWNSVKFVIYIIDKSARMILNDREIDLINQLQKSAKIDKGYFHPAAFYYTNPDSYPRLRKLVVGSHNIGNKTVKLTDNIEELCLYTGASEKALRELIASKDFGDDEAVPL